MLFVEVGGATKTVRVSNVKTLKAELFNMLATVSYAGKILTNGALDDFGVGDSATLTMTLKLGGGGKRGAAGEPKAAKTVGKLERLNTTKEELDEMKQLL